DDGHYVQEQLRKVGPELLRRCEMQTGDADGLGAGDVCRRIVDEDAVRRLQAELIEKVAVDPGVRLDETDLPGDDDAVEPVEERKARPGDRESLGRPVG